MIHGMLRERRRSLAVRGTGLLHTPAEPGFDRFVEAASAAFSAPIALLSLIHGRQQWVKASRGMKIGCIDRDKSFCDYALDRAGVLEICDPEGDARVALLPEVIGPPYVRYYIGAPLRLLSGIDVGALCVVDAARRQPASADQKAYLLGLARQASLALDARLDLVGDAA